MGRRCHLGLVDPFVGTKGSRILRDWRVSYTIRAGGRGSRTQRVATGRMRCPPLTGMKGV